MFKSQPTLSSCQCQKYKIHFCQTGKAHGPTGRKEYRRGEEGIIPPTVTPSKATTARLPQCEKTWARRLAVGVIHDWNLIMVPPRDGPESRSEPPSTPLGFEVVGWLWRWMALSRAKPEPQGARQDLTRHPHTDLLSPKAKLSLCTSTLLHRLLQRDVTVISESSPPVKIQTIAGKR